jgi:hypothetical protein
MGFIKTLATAAVIACMAVLSGIPGSAAEPLAPSSTATPMKLIPPPKRPTPHPETLQHRAKSEAKSEGKSAGTSHILRGAETYALIARLPWWRTVEMQTIPYPDKAFVSQALATADAWFATEFGGHGIASDEVIRIVDANDLNELDLASRNFVGLSDHRVELAGLYMPEASDPFWLQALLAMFSGALAAAFAARVLFI